MAKKKVGERSDGSSVHVSKTKETEVDPLRVFAEKLRDHKDLESRWAVLHEARVEYFRGKDFVAVLKNHPDLKKFLKEERLSTVDEEEIGNLLLKRKFIVRCDRMVKTLRPGKKKLSKWPARLELFADQCFSESDAFFAWTFERRRPFWQTILSFLVPIVTVACCLFPIFPHWCKLAVLYFCLTFLFTIFGVLFVRWTIFGSLWILLGKSVWFFPNILAEEATLTELFQFWPDTSKDDDPPPKKTTRFAFALLSALSLWIVIHHAPNEAARTRYQKKVSNIIDDVLVWKPNLAALTGSSAEVKQATPKPPSPDRSANVSGNLFDNTSGVEEDDSGQQTSPPDDLQSDQMESSLREAADLDDQDEDRVEESG